MPHCNHYKIAILHQCEEALKYSLFIKQDYHFFWVPADTWAKFVPSSVWRTFTMAYKWFKRREAPLFLVLDETFMSQPSVDPGTATFTHSSQTRTLTVCHQIQHSPRQRLGQVKVWPSQKMVAYWGCSACMWGWNLFNFDSCASAKKLTQSFPYKDPPFYDYSSTWNEKISDALCIILQTFTHMSAWIIWHLWKLCHLNLKTKCIWACKVRKSLQIF